MEREVSNDLWRATMEALAVYCGTTGASPGAILEGWIPEIVEFTAHAADGIETSAGVFVACGSFRPIVKTSD